MELLDNTYELQDVNCCIKRSIEGYSYDFNTNLWIFDIPHRKFNFNFLALESFITEDLLFELKLVISALLGKNKIGTSYKYLFNFKKFIKYTFRNNEFILLNKITSYDILNYFNKSNDAESECSALKTFIVHWHKFGYKLIDHDVIEILNKIKFKYKFQNQSVLTADPYKGPYTSNELSLILQSIEEKYQSNELSLKMFVLSYIYHCLGLRPIQVSLLKINDYYIKINEQNVKSHYLNVPRVKQKGVEYRGLFHEYVIDPLLAEILEWWITKVKAQWEYSGITRPFEDMPFFPDIKRDQLDEFRYHSTSADISSSYRQIGKIISVISERTGASTNLTPYRSRKTLGTRAAIEGKNANTIAVLLDHSRTSSVEHYVKFAREIATEIDNAIGEDIAPLICAFRGEIISEAPIAGTRRRIRSNNIHNPDTGLCVNPSGCGVYSKSGDLLTVLACVPFSCYTCPYFNAWNDIETHREHLRIMIDRQNSILKGYNENGNAQNHNMAHSLDITINAIIEVINLIESGEIKNNYDHN